MPGGRPTDYSQDLADRLCEILADGKSMRYACAMDDMPSKATVFRWLRTIPEFRDQYEISKSEAADSMTDEMLDIADNDEGDTQRDRLKVDTRKWIASKLKPKKYGDKLDLSSKDGSMTPQAPTVIKRVIIK